MRTIDVPEEQDGLVLEEVKVRVGVVVAVSSLSYPGCGRPTQHSSHLCRHLEELLEGRERLRIERWLRCHSLNTAELPNAWLWAGPRLYIFPFSEVS